MEKTKGVNLKIYYSESKAGGYVGMINGVAGCLSQGETLDELKSNLLDALSALSNNCKNNLESLQPLLVNENYTAIESNIPLQVKQ